MTFHPPSLGIEVLQTLSDELQKAMGVVLGRTVDTRQARDMLAHALGYEDRDGERDA